MADVMPSFAKVVRAIWTPDYMMQSMGYRKVEGVGWVRPVEPWDRRRVHDRPFTKKQARRHAWEMRKRRWCNRFREVARRVTDAWDVLRGKADVGEQ